MTRLFAITTSDPSLMRCELLRSRRMIVLDDLTQVLGLGAWDDAQLVQRQYGVGVTRADMWELPNSETALYAVGPLERGVPIEQVAQPFRTRQWLFGQAGAVDQPQLVRERLAGQLPDHLLRALKGPSLEEVVFATFLAELRSLGRTEDLTLEAPIAAQLLARTADHVERATEKAHRAQLALVATNGRIVVAASRGSRRLFYRLLEGDGVCERCGLSGDEKPTTSLARDHRRRRSILVVTDPLRPDGWLEVPDGRSIAVSRNLELQLV
jgi:glutamine amidotransferase